MGTNKSKKKARNKEKDSPNLNLQSTTAPQTDRIQNKYNVPLEHLQLAVTHDLPCFCINFDQSENLPSVVAVVEELSGHFERKQIKLINDFSVVRYTGNQVRIGLKNKTDYQPLCNQKAWPATILNKRITVHVPKFIPEQFFLVVRFIPPEFSRDLITKEVKRLINSIQPTISEK